MSRLAQWNGRSRTFNPVFLHRRNLFQRKSQRINHEQVFGYVDLVHFACLDSDDE